MPTCSWKANRGWRLDDGLADAGVIRIRHIEIVRRVDCDAIQAFLEINAHVIIAVITAIAGLIWALTSSQRAGGGSGFIQPLYYNSH